MGTLVKQTAVIVGATGGVGSALLEAVAGSGMFSRVHAVSRTAYRGDGAISAHIADVTDDRSVERAAEAIAGDGPVGLVMVASGILHAVDIAPEKSLGAIDPKAFARLFAVNVIGPALIAKHFVPLLPKQGRSIFAALSARIGSIEDNRLGGWYGYRASKAALNQFIRTLAVELKRTRPEAIALALHPGTVMTELSKPFRRDAAKPGMFTPEEAAAHLIKVLDAAELEQSGQLIAWDGSRIPF
jgi:NAD(P)-dependent dehydrogenase (short-subunit alcohol dehydrogenase family)